ncbi:hypothetical protein [Sulfurimonas sp. C5]|uniref:hypothetical protein n=1 Tax=Sulfurimonas sp. C5 TaxID=3036947 RepID=UPI0024544391|nr:hypothetical protein [Sulfurimonas sp. C5]MDH4944749.1 hypothetical protein [Sulfurimonas sp. C5]
MWLNQLKIAVSQKDMDLLGSLLADIPNLTDKEELDSAIVLLAQAKEIIQELQNETAASMKQIKKNLEFLKSTETTQPHRLDVKS